MNQPQYNPGEPNYEPDNPTPVIIDSCPKCQTIGLDWEDNVVADPLHLQDVSNPGKSVYRCPYCNHLFQDFGEIWADELQQAIAQELEPQTDASFELEFEINHNAPLKAKVKVAVIFLEVPTYRFVIELGDLVGDRHNIEPYRLLALLEEFKQGWQAAYLPDYEYEGGSPCFEQGYNAVRGDG